MTCVSPFWRKIPGSKVPLPLACGQCVACKVNRAREWSFRMVAESGYWENAAFLTLTYADDTVVSLSKRDLQLAFKIARKDGLKFKYFAAGEYGGQFGRPHYHVAIFYNGGLGFVPDESFGKNNGHLSWWPHGLANLGTFSKESARYTADYLLKEFGIEYPGYLEAPFRLVSVGLGRQYLLDNRRVIEQAEALRFGKSWIGIPRYYRKFMATFLDESHVPLRVSKFKESLFEGGKIRGYIFGIRQQRAINFVARQELFRKEF